MLRFSDFYADKQQTDDKIALPLTAHARTRGNYVNTSNMEPL